MGSPVREECDGNHDFLAYALQAFCKVLLKLRLMEFEFLGAGVWPWKETWAEAAVPNLQVLSAPTSQRWGLLYEKV